MHACVGLYQISDLLSGFEFEWLRLTAVKCSRVENQVILASQKCSGSKVNLKCIRTYLLNLEFKTMLFVQRDFLKLMF